MSKRDFIAVDLWQKEFSSISVKAIYAIYCKKFKLSKED